MTEQEVRRYLRQMRDDDSQLALKKFYDLCYDRFYRIAWYYLHDDEAAQDIVLDVFFRIWQRRQSLQEIAVSLYRELPIWRIISLLLSVMQLWLVWNRKRNNQRKQI